MSDAALEKSLVPAVTRAIAVLDYIAESNGRPVGLSDLARAVGIAKSSASNLCAALEKGGLLHRNEMGYVLGRRTVELGGAYLRSFDQIREFYQLCAELPHLRFELVQIAALDGTEVFYLARHEGRAPRFSASVGERFPASLTAVGNALLSLLAPADIESLYGSSEDWPRLTDNSTTNFQALQVKLAKARESGFGLDEREVFPNIVGLALPIPPRHAGDVPLAVGVSILTPYDSPDYRSIVMTELRMIVDHLTNPMSSSQVHAAVVAQ